MDIGRIMIWILGSCKDVRNGNTTSHVRAGSVQESIKRAQKCIHTFGGKSYSNENIIMP